MEQRVVYKTGVENLLQTSREPDTMDAGPPDIILVSRTELEQEHIHLMARVQQLRRLLGFPPLPTGKQIRKQQK